MAGHGSSSNSETALVAGAVGGNCGKTVQLACHGPSSGDIAAQAADHGSSCLQAALQLLRPAAGPAATAKQFRQVVP